MTTPHELIPAWRARAQLLQRHGATEAGKTAEALANELEQALRDEDNAVLTIAEASAESGYTPQHLTRQIRGGKIPNAGRQHAPRILRADLPRKPGSLPVEPRTGTLADARRQAVRAVVTSE